MLCITMDSDILNPAGAGCVPGTMTLTSPSSASLGGDKVLPLGKIQLDKSPASMKLFQNSAIELDKRIHLNFQDSPMMAVNSFSLNSEPMDIDAHLQKNSDFSTKSPNSHIDDDDDEMDQFSYKDDELVECGTCNTEFSSLQLYMDHTCTGPQTNLQMPSRSDNNNDLESMTDDSELSDGESFDGKIIYNPDGSAYIIEGDSDLSDLDSLIDIPHHTGVVVDKKGDNLSKVTSLPQIANAFYVPRNPTAVFSDLYSLPSIRTKPPIMHSYRVYDVRSGKNKNKSGENQDGNSNAGGVQSSSTSSTSSSARTDPLSVPTKPILMCFVCKLSFGFVKSFTAHAGNEHNMVLNSEEREIVSRKNASAIIQGIGSDKEPLMSFLEPSSPPMKLRSVSSNLNTSPELLVSCSSSGVSSAIIPEESTTVSYMYSKPKLSDTFNMNLSQHNSYSESEKTVKDTNNLKSPSVGFSSKLEKDSSHSNSQSVFLNKAAIESSITNCDDNSLPVATSATTNHIPPLSLLSPLTNHSPVFLGMCDEHPQGRAECPKCDMVLGSSQSLGGHMTMMHSRNSCKTLKCPKCNWHYKYQETLEIHLKEKHPENETQCIYCVTNQSHPRLARGESYSCGYKPYRCEVCNYSTTTKGNLSIHMQSDKHLNNVQDLASGGTEMKVPPQTYPIDNSSLVKKPKPKPTWRCDVCNYETNVARNLRIHMTSEKHTHNMMVLQQNMKHMQRDMQLQHMNQLIMLQQDPSYMALQSPLPGGGNFHYDQSLLMTGIPGSFGEIPVDLSKENGGTGVAFDPQAVDMKSVFQCCVCNSFGSDSIDNLHQHLQMDRTKHREQENIVVASGTYMCNLCTYKTNLKANFQLHCKTDKHLQRLQLVNHIKEGGSSNEWRLKYLNVSNPVQVRCNACDYYTNSIHKLQIHTGNPRHEGNSQLFIFLQMKARKIEAKNKYYHCTICNFSTKAKLNLIQHVRSLKHLRTEGVKQMQLNEEGKADLDFDDVFVVREYNETDSINFDVEGLDVDLWLDQDLDPQTSLDCDDVDNIHMSKLDGEAETDETNGIVSSQNNGIVTSQNNESWEKKTEASTLLNCSGSSNSTSGAHSNTGTAEGSEQIHVCPYCDYNSVDEMRIQAHILSQHSHKSKGLLCPLCQEETNDKSKLEKHLVTIHSVTAGGLKRLLLMVDQGDWMMSPPTMSSTPVTPQLPIDESGEINTDILEAEAARLAAEDAIDTAALPEKGDFEDQYRCQTCSKTFTNIDALYAHQNELGHLELKQTPRGPGYLCWKKGCNQYFKTAQALQIHFREIHAKRQQLSISDRHSYKFRCSQCSLAFKMIEKLQLHLQYHLIRSATKCMFCSRTFRSIAAVKKHVESVHTDLNDAELEQYHATTNANSLALASLIGTSGLEKFFSCAGSEDSPTNGSSDHENNADMSVDSAKSESNNSDHEKSGIKLETPDSPSESTTSRMSSPQGDKLERSMDGSQDILDKMDLSEYKDQQFLEDYINSMAIAEGSYEDPGRKYKCHRCKVAFTKQSYLTAHNKTLLHRKGDKLSYPMEKYLDPNRPFKCDVCKESFTQKNILLVHYNSVSHLHKLKQITHGQSSSATTLAQPVTPPAVALPSSSCVTSVTTPPPISIPCMEDKNKPYKCNICKVAYNQGSTLDIHVRSVAHQTRTSKLQELALSGEIDITRPFIEQPIETTKIQQQKVLSEILQQKQPALAQSHASQSSLIFQGIPSSITGLSQLPCISNVISPTTFPNCSSTETNITKSLPESVAFVGVADIHMSSSALQSLSTPPKLSLEQNIFPSEPYSMTPLTTQSPLMITNHAESLMQLPLLYPGSSGRISPLSAQQYHFRSRHLISRFKPQIQRNLLENIGFECVMQFNEFNQSIQPDVEKQDEDMDIEENDAKIDPDIPSEIKTEDEPKNEEMEDECKTDIPELNRCKCTTCQKGFSSIWVLKAHREEVHRDVVPIAMIEKFGKKFKNDLEKKQSKEAEISLSSHTDVPSSTASTSNNDIVINPEMPPPPPPPPPPQAAPILDVNQMMSTMFGMSLPVPFGMAMNMHPPLMPMMLPMGMDNSLLSQMSPMADNTMLQKHVQQAALQNQKRARTRINDEQLKILRAHFDINNSPSEEQVITMSEQSGLPTKVIKHWFRNTLFKERQRNKDSPYNFNNPPSTTLDWEEYEKTGKIPAIIDKVDIDENKCDIGLLDANRDVKKEKMEVMSDTADSLPGSDTTSIDQICDMSQPQTPDLCDSRDNYITLPLTPVQQSTTTTAAAHTLLSLSMTSSDQFEPIMSDDKHRQEMSIFKGDSRLDSYVHDLSPQSNSSAQKRANRTRFSDYQIKMLQEYFEQNAYPKDDELDHLSKTLSLSARVIVVWFQNARQKARKIYENHPPVDLKEDPNSPFQRTPGLNYQCRKCNSVFQKYYELIKHQKKNCLLESNNKPTSADNINSDDSNSTSLSQDEATYFETSPISSSSTCLPTTTNIGTGANLKCEKCHIVFDRVELWQEHQDVHNLSMITGFPSSGAFGVLQNMAAVQQQEKISLKRQNDDLSEDDRDEQMRDKRLRTTILPEQLDYLYQKYQLDCNPSRKQLEHIASEVGLKKRVVQVWFQNTRARERKGHFRAHQQLIHKRCPFCRALFRAKSALESHLATKHPEEMAKGDINIDSIPDAALESPNTPQPILPIPPSVLQSPGMSTDISKLLSPPPVMQGFLPIMHHGGLGIPALTDPLQLSMKQFYEDSFKKYIHELSATSYAPKTNQAQETPSKSKKPDSSLKFGVDDDNDAPLDLSKPLKVNTDTERISDGPSTDVSDRSFEDYSSRKFSLDDSMSESLSEQYDQENELILGMGAGSPSPPNHFGGNRRYRTQMTSLQVRIMKVVFQDYKTPTMAECEMLGREIGLQKRVVQVWFQNARAKEKKSKLEMAKTFGTDMDFNKPPDECSLCNFKYSHKCTIQDHIFTRKHIDKVKAYIQSQSDAEREMTDPSSMSHVLHQQRDLEKMRKAWDEAASQPHLAQLQAMGLNPLAMPSTSVAGLATPFDPADFFPDMKAEKSKKSDGSQKDTDQKEEVHVKKEPMHQEMIQFGSHVMPQFSGLLPGLDPSLLSYMYPGYFPGMGMPFLQPGMMPGAEHMLVYDPLTFGTPLPLLQIPHQAIKDVILKLQEPKATVAQYTQDCKSISSLKVIVSNVDYGCVREAIVDVGYICKKCQMVYPAKDACMSHQQSLCFAGGKVPEGVQLMLKLEQIQYECKVCTDKFSTIQEYKSHCQLESHKIKVMKYQQKLQAAGSSNNKPNSITTSPGSSANKSNSITSPGKSCSKTDTITSQQGDASPSKVQSASKEILMLTEKSCSETDNQCHQTNVNKTLKN